MMSIRRRIVTVLCLILVAIIIVFLWINNAKVSEQLSQTNVIVVSYENEDKNDHKKLLDDLLTKYDYVHEFVGSGEIWRGFGNKIKRYQNYIKNSNLNDDDILILIDSRDIYVNRISDDIIEIFKNYYTENGGDLDANLKLVFSSESACCTTGVTEDMKMEMEKIALHVDKDGMEDNDRYHLNSGMCIGYVKAFKKIFLDIDMDYTDDDQTEITRYWMDHQDSIILDYNELFFSNAHIWGNENTLGGCPYLKKDDHFVIKDRNIRPFFIQTPAKYWKCYNYLYDIE